MPKRKFTEFTQLVRGMCNAELDERGMRRAANGTHELSLPNGFTGWVGLPIRELPNFRGGFAGLVAPMVGVRDNEVNRLVAELRGLTPGDDPDAQARCVVTKELRSLIPERGQLPTEWVVSDNKEAGQVARRVAEDIVFAGFPYMESLASSEALFEEFKRTPRRIMWPRESAVTYMMHGDLEGAKGMLRRLARPVSQDPIVWDDQDADTVRFFAAFESHFNVDLGIGDWPVRDQMTVPRTMIKIRDRGVVPTAVRQVGRPDLAERGAALSEAEIGQISERASEIFASINPEDSNRAIGLAAVEFLTSRD